MKLVVQRVEKAKVTLESSGEVTGEIGTGLFVLVGFGVGDSEKEVDTLSEKLFKLRVMRDGEGKMNLSLKDTSSEILVVSQFTLYADTTGGNRPSFINAAQPDDARRLYKYFVGRLKDKGLKVQTGRFGEYMKIETVLDGPVTIIYNDK